MMSILLLIVAIKLSMPWWFYILWGMAFLAKIAIAYSDSQK